MSVYLLLSGTGIGNAWSNKVLALNVRWIQRARAGMHSLLYFNGQPAKRSTTEALQAGSNCIK